MNVPLKKRKKFSFQSLGIRIFLISFILLVLPLLFHNLSMYWEDYQEKKDNLFLALKIVGDNKAYDVEQYIECEQKFLSWIAREPITQSLLQRAQSEEKLSKISFLSVTNEDIGFSQNSKEIKDHLKRIAKKRAFLFEKEQEKILVIPIPVKKDDNLEGYLISETPLESLKQVLFQPFSFPYPLTVRFYSDRSDPYPENEEVEPFLVQREGQSYFAKRVLFPETNFSLMFYVLESDITDLSLWKVLGSILQLLIFFFLIGGVVVLFLTTRLSRPINHLLDVMDKVANQKLSARYKTDRMGFEINILGSHFNTMIDSLLEYQEEIEKVHIRNESLRKELEIGRSIQQSLFPKKLPQVKDFDIASYCMQAKEVGGDFYDLFIRDNRLIFCIADVSGKGISACLYSLGIRSLIRSAFYKETDMTRALQRVNSLFYEDVGDIGVFTTLWIGSLDLHSHVLDYCSLGHHPALLKTGEKIIELYTQSNALGPFKEVFLDVQSTTLAKGDLLLLYTDGVIDRQNREKVFFGYENIQEFLKEQKTSNSKDTIHTLVKELDHFAEKEPLYDDLTLLSIRKN